MRTDQSGEPEWELIRHSIVRLRSRIMAMTFAAAGGMGLFVATLWLLIRGGPNVGQHLSLLRHYFPGYSVSLGGSLVGFGYGAVVGGLVGWSIARVYNAVASRYGSKRRHGV